MSEPRDYSGASVLFVDDEENILNALKRLFMDEEYAILTASSGEQGLTILRKTTDVALIVSDQRMPGMGGSEFLTLSRELAPDAVRMVLTGYADVNSAMDAINKAGANRYLVKPWDDTMLIHTIRDGIDLYLMKLENRRLTELVRKQNEELQEWNTNLKRRVMEQTATIRQQNEGLSARNTIIKNAFESTMLAFSRVVELCGTRLRMHTRNVTALAVGIARDLSLSEQETEDIRSAALLHDIGMIGMPENVIDKHPANMNPEEQALYRQHSIRGQSSIDVVEELRRAGTILRHHHEQFNGKGFPDGLRGEAIPLGARIIAYADFIDMEMYGQTNEAALVSTLRKAAYLGGMLLDPKLDRSAQRNAKYLYYKAPGTITAAERYYTPDELAPGLRVVRDVYSGTGLLLLTAGAILDKQLIESVRRYYEIDPPNKGVLAVNERRAG